jgi:oligoribonuclease
MEIMMENKNNNNLIWLDMEMSGLDPENDKVLEIAVVITDPFLKIIAESPVFVLHQDDEVLARMDAWNQSTHGKSGLIEKVKNSKHNEEGVTHQLLDFMEKYVGKNKSPMCGNSICQDRRFMAKHMPELEKFFHYRNLDVSVFKELSKRWKPEIIDGFKKAGKHEALADIIESIDELKYYREHFIKI